MIVEIPEEIHETEVILRYLFSKDLKNKNNLGKFKASLDTKLLKTPYIFFDNRGEVSLQRKNYLSDEKCREIGDSNVHDLLGYIKFLPREYFSVISGHRLEPGREEFDANLLWSPLNEKGVPRTDRPVFTNDLGLPAHCGINYINPAPVTNEEPNTAIRMFSHKLFNICDLELVG